MVRITWPDGVSLGADDASSALQAAADDQWTPCSVAEFRAILCERVEFWSGVTVEDVGSDHDLLTRLAAAGLLRYEPDWQPANSR